MKTRHLFLFGGSPPFSEKLGRKFAELSLIEKGKVAILFVERDGWEAYMEKYTAILRENGVREFSYIPLTDSPQASIIQELITCTGIIIGGGETELYRSYIVDTEIGRLIHDKYNQGIPIAGFSAGALISPKNCVIPPIDNAKNQHLFLEGLGLIKDCVICVHFTKWDEKTNMKIALTETKALYGYGIDDGAGMYFANETLMDTEGEKIHTFIRG